jgi:hypothetical protein
LEYRRAHEYRRDAARRRREGWRVVSVIERPQRARRRLVSRGHEVLVTYSRPARLPEPMRPLRWLLAADGQSRGRRLRAARQWWWLALVLLVVFLLLGVANFFADAGPTLGAAVAATLLL